jgi:carbon storage regulator CsrA
MGYGAVLLLAEKGFEKQVFADSTRVRLVVDARHHVGSRLGTREDRTMLVLSRRVGERIRIGADIWLVVLEINGDKVRLGLDAPKEIDIVREELIEDDNPAS